MNLGLISLIVLAIVIALAYYRKINTGIIGIVAAFLLGFILLTETKTGVLVPVSSSAGKSALLVSGWNSGMFLTLFGVTFLFGIARANQTLSILTAKLVSGIGGKNWLIPIVIFMVSALISVIGPGPVNGMAIIAPIAGELAHRQRIHPLLMMLSVGTGNLAGGLAPITPSGYVAVSYAERGGVTIGYNLLFNMAIAFTLLFILIYVFYRGWHSPAKDTEMTKTESPKMKRIHYTTLAVIVVVILAIIIGHFHVGFTCLTGGVLLLLLKTSTEKEALGQVPWGTIIMVCGVGVLVNVMDYAGGIDYLTMIASQFINDSTATPIMVISGALMSSVASASGVVMPTLIPVAIHLSQQFGIDASALIYGVVLGAHTSCISPFSTVGALSLSSLDQSVDKHKIFIHLIGWAVGLSILASIFAYFHLLLYY